MEMDYAEMVRRNNCLNTFAVCNGIRAVEVGKEHALVELAVSERSLNPSGMVHGGASYTLCDCAAGLAARSAGGSYVTQSADFHYYRPAMDGRMRAEGTVIHRGHTTVVVQTEARLEDGTLAAGGIFTMFRLNQPSQDI